MNKRKSLSQAKNSRKGAVHHWKNVCVRLDCVCVGVCMTLDCICVWGGDPGLRVGVGSETLDFVCVGA